MDKNTMSNHGWVVIVALVLVAMIGISAVATNFFSNGTKNHLDGLQEKLNEAFTDPPEKPVMLEGDGQTFHKFAPTALSFRSSASLDEFKEVQVNGETVDPAYYTLTEGSTIVTLSIDYLQSLDATAHEVKIVSESGAPSASFEVIEPETNEYGFYYNQPYRAYISIMDAGDTVVIIRKNGILEIYYLWYDITENCQYACNNGIISFTSEVFGAVEVTIGSGGELVVDDLVFSISESVVADDDYIYLYSENDGGYVVYGALDETKAFYAPIRTNINGFDTTTIRREAFGSHTNMEIAPEIPETVTTIDTAAFAFCTSLKSIELPASVEDIKMSAFNGCTSLESIVIPEGVSRIEIAVFQDCTSLTSVAIPSGVISIAGSAFARCTNIVSVRIPDSVTFVGSQAFGSCTSLEHIVFEGTIEQWNSITLEEYDGLTPWNYNVPATYVQCSDGTVALS